MLHDDFRRRYHTEPMIASITDMLVGALRSGDVTPQDVARCAVLAATIYAERYQAPLTIVIRKGEPCEFVLTEKDLERVIARARSTEG